MTAVARNFHEISGNLYGEKRYGEVLITERHTVLLRCAVCAEEHRDYQKFLQHIFAHHYETKAIQSDWLYDPVKAERNDSVGEYSKLTAKRVKLASSSKCLERRSDSIAEASFDCDELPAAARHAENEQNCSPESAPSPTNHIRSVKNRVQNAQDEKDQRKCDICGSVYKDKYIMRQHRRRHSGVKPYPCKQCDMRFYTSTELRLHMPRHTGERKFVCLYCGQSYKNSPALRTHEMSHTNLRPHKCDVCDKRFYTTTNLKDHMIVHTKEQNHECNICKNRFSRRKALMQHMKLHADAREYECNMCSMAFNQLAALFSHKKNQHKVVTLKGDLKVLAEVEVCRRCQLCFVDKAALLEHHKKTHAQEDEVVTTDALEEVQSETM